MNYNTAELSACDLRELFPASCVVEMELVGPHQLVLPQAEALVVKHVVEKRRREFTAGRVAARRALTKFGLYRIEIPKRSDGPPQWPQGFVGSISHAGEHAAAVVARQSDIAALGMDLELSRGISFDLLPFFMVPEEQRWLAQLPRHEQLNLATVVFSAKEAFYKLQYCISNEWLDFHDVLIRVLSPDRFSAQIISSGKKFPCGEFFGKFARFDSIVATGISLKI